MSSVSVSQCSQCGGYVEVFAECAKPADIMKAPGLMAAWAHSLRVYPQQLNALQGNDTLPVKLADDIIAFSARIFLSKSERKSAVVLHILWQHTVLRHMSHHCVEATETHILYRCMLDMFNSMGCRD